MIPVISGTSSSPDITSILFKNLPELYLCAGWEGDVTLSQTHLPGHCYLDLHTHKTQIEFKGLMARKGGFSFFSQEGWKNFR